MDVIYGLIPGMILLGVVAVAVLFWAARSGQFDDFEGEASRILMDEDLQPERPQSSATDAEEQTAEISEPEAGETRDGDEAEGRDQSSFPGHSVEKTHPG